MSAGARFCHNCAAKLADAARGTGSYYAWIVAAVLAITLLIVLAVALGPAAEPAPPTAMQFPVVPQSPREIANEYFNQSMMANERGDATAAVSFGGMALEGYAALGGLDNDLRLHVGLIYLVMGNLEGALAQADSLEMAVPGHLYASVLRQRAYEARGDSLGVEAAYRRFLEYHQQETNAGRPEYNEHLHMLESFLTAARNSVGNR